MRVPSLALKIFLLSPAGVPQAAQPATDSALAEAKPTGNYPGDLWKVRNDAATLTDIISMLIVLSLSIQEFVKNLAHERG